MLERLEDVEVCGEAADGEAALERLAQDPADVVLLDVQMPEMTGLEVAEQLPPTIHVVFTTAYAEYAVQAFEAAAVDYLLKPISPQRLGEALDRVRRLEAPTAARELTRLLKDAADREEPPRIAARLGDTTRLFDPRQISRFTSRNDYTVFHLNGRSYSLDDSMKALAERLETWGFLRIHRGELVNLHRVKSLRRVDDTTVVDLDDGQHATASRRRVKALKRALGILESS
jgi:DNA-binding LytR/AlgR family response regulator